MTDQKPSGQAHIDKCVVLNTHLSKQLAVRSPLCLNASKIREDRITHKTSMGRNDHICNACSGRPAM